MLVVQDVSVYYGRTKAIEEVSLHVEKGQIVAVLGANGAGKTTLLRTISGVLSTRRGSITFDGREIARNSPDRIVSLGVSQVPEGRQIFGPLTVGENLELGAYQRYGKRSKQEIEADLGFVFDLFPLLRNRLAQRAGTLSGGEQQMLTVGRALMASPKLLLLDEPSLGLAPLVIEMIFGVLVRLNKERGLTILLVEQNAMAALRIADYGYVLQTGKVVMDGPASELIEDEGVRHFYLGQR